MNYIFEQVHHIDRHELQIDSVSLCTKLGIAITVTRNCIGIWKVDQDEIHKLNLKFARTILCIAIGMQIVQEIVRVSLPVLAQYMD
jgi:hypothetical protein